MDILKTGQTHLNKENLRHKVLQMTHLDVRRSVAAGLADNLENFEGVDAELVALKDFWKENSKENSLTEEGLKEKVRQTVKITHDYFAARGLELPNLQAGAPFIEHIHGYVGDTPVGCSQVMHDFCQYVCFVSQLSPEKQTQSFVAFPPEAEFLNCLDGSKERIEIEYRLLKASQSDYGLFLKAHQEVMNEYEYALRHHVPDDRKIHIISYLEDSLGLCENTSPPHAEGYIPAHMLWNMHRNYAPKLKKIILERAFEVDDILTQLQEDFPKTNFSKITSDNPQLGEVITSVNQRLRLHQIDDEHFFELDEEEEAEETKGEDKKEEEKKDEQFYTLNQDVINQARDRLFLPALRHLDRVLSDDPRFQSQNPSALKDLEGVLSDDPRLDSEEPEDIEAIKASLKDDNLYNTEKVATMQSILAANTSESSENVSYEDFILAFEALSILGSECVSHSGAIFLDVTVKLEARNASGFIAQMRDNVSQSGLYHDAKINKMENTLTEYAEIPESFYPVLEEDCQFPGQLGELLCGNYNKTTILNYIEKTDIGKLCRDLDFYPGGYLEKYKELNEACENLMNRPDKLEILDGLKSKIEANNQDRNMVQVALPGQFSLGCLEAAAKVNDVGSCEFMFCNFLVGDGIFENQTLMLIAATKQDDALVKMFIERHKHTYRNIEEVAAGEESRMDKLLTCISESQPKKAFRSPVLAAAIYGNTAFIAAIRDEGGIDIAVLDACNVRNDMRMIHYAAEGNQVGFLKFLGKAGIDLAFKNDEKVGAVHVAAREGHGDVIRALKECGVKAENFVTTTTLPSRLDLMTDEEFQEVRNDYGRPLEIATYHEHRDAILAIGDIAKKMFTRDEAGNKKRFVDLPDSQGKSLIHYAAQRGLENVIPALCSIGGDVNRQTYRDKDTPLMLACLHGHAEAIKELLEFGADRFRKNSHGKGPVDFLPAEGVDPALLRSLIVTKQARTGESALHQLFKCNVSMGQWVKTDNVDINEYYAVNKKGETPIILAAEAMGENSDPKPNKLFKEMKAQGVDLNRCDEQGYSSISRAAHLGAFLAINNLMLLGADINNKNLDGDTALHVAIKDNDISAIKCLLSCGADQFVTNAEGISARQAASLATNEHVLTAFQNMKKRSLKQAVIRNNAASVTQLLGLAEYDNLDEMLMLAVQTGDVNVVTALVEAGACENRETLLSHVGGQNPEEVRSYLESLDSDDKGNIVGTLTGAFSDLDDDVVEEIFGEENISPSVQLAPNSPANKVVNDNDKSNSRL